MDRKDVAWLANRRDEIFRLGRSEYAMLSDWSTLNKQVRNKLVNTEETDDLMYASFTRHELLNEELKQGGSSARIRSRIRRIGRSVLNELIEDLTELIEDVEQYTSYEQLCEALGGCFETDMLTAAQYEKLLECIQVLNPDAPRE